MHQKTLPLVGKFTIILIASKDTMKTPVNILKI